MSKVNISKSFMIILVIMAAGFGTALGLWATFNLTNNLTPPTEPDEWDSDIIYFDVSPIPDLLDVTVTLDGVSGVGHEITVTTTVTLLDTSKTLDSGWMVTTAIDHAGHLKYGPHDVGGELNATITSQTFVGAFTPDIDGQFRTYVLLDNLSWS